jgi:hypothetical protein
MYAEGLGTQKDLSESVKWYRRAAETGLANGQHNLAGTYEAGQGVPQDDVQALKWYILAVERSKGKFHDHFFKDRESLKEKMSPEQISKAERLALQWNEQFSGTSTSSPR